jgi:RimJ/RimL family protein N-acetyltransferase
MSAMTLPIPVIETERLTLRAPQLDDLKPMAAFFETTRSHMVGGPRDAAGSYTSLVSRLGHWVLNGYGLWHIDDKATGDFIGWTGMIFAPGWMEPELGWTLFEGAEGKGFAYEAATAARRYAARHFGLDGVISYIAPANSRSQALAERLGAQIEIAEAELLGKACQVWRHPKLEQAA